MSFRFIEDLGITRLKEVGKILRIPRYTTYTNPRLLKAKIKEYLNGAYQVRSEHLDMIGQSREKVLELTQHIREIVIRRKKSSSSRSFSPSRASPSRASSPARSSRGRSSDMADALTQLAQCLNDLNVAKSAAGVVCPE